MSRWYFWVLAPVMLATLGLARPRRFQWALRAVAGVILVAYLAYAIHEARGRSGSNVDALLDIPNGSDSPPSDERA